MLISLSEKKPISIFTNYFSKGSHVKQVGKHWPRGNIFIFGVKQQKLTTRGNFCLGLRKHVNIEGGEERAGRPQQDSSVIIAARPDRIGVYCERSIFLLISLPSRLISSTTSPHAALRRSFVLYISHA